VGEKLYLVETEFLFGINPSDRWHNKVMQILELFKKREGGELRFSASALLEMSLVLQSRGLRMEKIEETLFLAKQKLFESNVLEEWLNSDDVIRAYELLKKFDVEYFDAMHAAVALGRNAVLVTNDKVYETLGVKTISFDDLIKEAKV
jgi:predicted nucleic acid-binding protein